MANINVTEQHNRVIVQEDGTVRVVSVGIPGPKGEQGPPGDADMSTYDDHIAATEDIHGISDTAQLATLTDIENVEIDTSVYDAHLIETTDVHGIPDTTALETQSGAQSRVDAHDAPTDVHGVGASTVASTDDVSTAQGAAQNHADSAVTDHNAATAVHGVDTTQLATQADVDAVLPDPTVDGDVLTLADGSPTWAAPEGGGGLDPDGEETITGDWHFDRTNLRVGSGTSLAIGIDASTGSTWNVAIGNGAHAASGAGHSSVSIGTFAGSGNSNQTHVGRLSGRASDGARLTCVGDEAGRFSIGNFLTALGGFSGKNNAGTNVTALGYQTAEDNSGSYGIFIGTRTGRDNTRDNRLIVDTVTGSDPNLVDPLIDGRFRDGTDGDSFEYSKGVKVNGHLEATDQLILRSPDGSRWAITVDDSGNLSTSPATEEITP